MYAYSSNLFARLYSSLNSVKISDSVKQKKSLFPLAGGSNKRSRFPNSSQGSGFYQNLTDRKRQRPGLYRAIPSMNFALQAIRITVQSIASVLHERQAG